jgi:hypothetical protein
MPRLIDDIIADLHAFTPTTHDFNYEGRSYLIELTSDVLEAANPERAIAALLGVLERYPDEDLGTPGAVVHTLEELPGYEPYLLESARNYPSPYTVQMVSHLINSTEHLPTKRDLLQLIKDIQAQEAAPETAKEQAKNILDWHRAQGLE